MNNASCKVCWTMGLVGLSTVVFAGEPKTAPPHEPAGFVVGGVIGAFAAGPVGAVVGAGLGTWLGNRVHRASEAAKAESRVATLEGDQDGLARDKAALEADKSALVRNNAILTSATGELTATNRALTARLDDLSLRVDAVASAEDAATPMLNAAKVLDGLQGDVLFRTGSAEIGSDVARGLAVLAAAVAKSSDVTVRVDGYADPRGTAETNLKLSEARAEAVRDLFLAAGVNSASLEINAYGKSQSVAADADGYALERRVRLTLKAQGDAAVAREGVVPPPRGNSGVTAGRAGPPMRETE